MYIKKILTSLLFTVFNQFEMEFFSAKVLKYIIQSLCQRLFVKYVSRNLYIIF